MMEPASKATIHSCLPLTGPTKAKTQSGGPWRWSCLMIRRA